MAIEDHEEKKLIMKETNMNRAERLIISHNLRNLFQSWKNVIKYTQMQKN